MQVKMWLQELIPGVQDHGGAKLAAQATPAKVEQGLTGTAKELSQQEPFISQQQRVQLMR